MSVAYVHAHESAEPHAAAVWALSFAGPDRVLSAGADGALALWDAHSAARVNALPRAPLGVNAVSAGADGARALYKTLDGSVGLLDVEAFEVLATARDGAAWAAALAPDAQTYATAGAGGAAHIHSAAPDAFSEVRAALVPDSRAYGVCVAYSPDGARVAVGTHAGAVHVFDAHTGALAASLAPHARAVRALAWAPDAHLLASGGEDGRLALHDVRHARGAGSVGALPGHGGAWVLAADAAPDGRLLLSAGTDGTAKLWDLGMRAAVGAVQDAKGSVWATRWRPGASAAAFATGAEDGVVRWYRGAGME